MLIKKSGLEDEIVTIKTSSGEEIVTKLIKELEDCYLVSKPLVLTATSKGITMVPYLFTVNPNKDIRLSKSVMLIELTEESAAKQYLQATTMIQMV
jgi:hypothetical protein